MTQQTNVGVWFGGQADLVVMEPPQTEVRVDGQVEPRVRMDHLEMRLGAAPRAGFSVGFGRDSGSGQDLRLDEMAPRICPGAIVSARLLRGGVLPGAARNDLVMFEGRIGRIEMVLDADGEALHFEAEDPAGEVLRRRLGGQRVWTSGGDAEHVDGPPLVFNPDGQPNASPDRYDPGDGDPYTLFAPASPAGAVAWTLDEAIAYLLGEYGRAQAVGVPSPGAVRRGVGTAVIRDVRLEGRTLGEGLDALLELAGGRVRVAAEPQAEGVGRRLELWFPGRAPGGWLSHQAVGEGFDSRATQFAGLAVRMEFESAPRRYVARGDRKVYESTFDLVAGWDDALASYDPDDFSPSRNPNFDAVRDVFRKWVLNEAGEYSESPYNRGPAPDLSALFEGAPYVRRHRRFLKCFSCDGLGRSRGVCVEVSLDGGTTWQQTNLSLRIFTGECGVYVASDPLPARYLAAAMRGLVRVRVTAAIESDACLLAERATEGAADLPGRTRYLSVPAGYRFRRVAPTSTFYGQGGAEEVDDSAQLQQLVDAAYETDRRSPVPTRIHMPWLAMGHRDGERLLGIRGRRLDLARQHTGYESAPVARRIRYVFAPAPRTELELE